MEPFHLRAIGLPSVWLLNGIVFHENASYSTTDVHGLLQAIAREIETTSELSEAEMRFLLRWGRDSDNKSSGTWICAPASRQE